MGRAGDRVIVAASCSNCGTAHAVPARRRGGLLEYTAPMCGRCGWWNVCEPVSGQPVMIDRETFRRWRASANDPRRAAEAAELASLRHEVRALRRALGWVKGVLPT